MLLCVQDDLVEDDPFHRGLACWRSLDAQLTVSGGLVDRWGLYMSLHLSII